MSIESVMPSSHLILCCPLLLLPPILPSIRVFSNGSTLRMRWPKYWSFSFSIIPSKEIPGLISFRMDQSDLLAVQGTLKLTKWSCLDLNPSRHQNYITFAVHAKRFQFYFPKNRRLSQINLMWTGNGIWSFYNQTWHLSNEFYHKLVGSQKALVMMLMNIIYNNFVIDNIYFIFVYIVSFYSFSHSLAISTIQQILQDPTDFKWMYEDL